MRRQILAQREGKLAAQMPWFGDNGQKLLAGGNPDEQKLVNGGGRTDGPDVSGVVDVVDARNTGVECVSRGEHADSVVAPG